MYFTIYRKKPSKEISHCGRMRNISVSLDFFEGLFLSENYKVVKTDTTGYHADCQTKNRLGFLIAALPFLDFDCGINHLCQTESADKFIYEKPSAVTDKSFVLLKDYLCSLGGVNLLIFFIFTLQVIRMKIFYMINKALCMADLMMIENTLDRHYRWIRVKKTRLFA